MNTLDTKRKYTYQRTVEGATYTNYYVSSLPQDMAIAHLQRTWGTCVWTKQLRPDFKILSIEPVEYKVTW